jgi:hypothetical protein
VRDTGGEWEVGEVRKGVREEGRKGGREEGRKGVREWGSKEVGNEKVRGWEVKIEKWKLRIEYGEWEMKSMEVEVSGKVKRWEAGECADLSTYWNGQLVGHQTESIVANILSGSQQESKGINPSDSAKRGSQQKN